MGNIGMPGLDLLAPLLPEGHFCICFLFHTELGATQEEPWRREPCSAPPLVGPVTRTIIATADLGGGERGGKKEKRGGKPGACSLPP